MKLPVCLGTATRIIDVAPDLSCVTGNLKIHLDGDGVNQDLGKFFAYDDALWVSIV
jgi:hypothetical protein